MFLDERRIACEYFGLTLQCPSYMVPLSVAEQSGDHQTAVRFPCCRITTALNNGEPIMKLVQKQDKVMEVLAPLQDDLVRIVHNAWKDWLHSTEHQRHHFDLVQHAIVWDRITVRAKELLPVKHGVKVLSKSRSWWFAFENVLFRFKKADRTGQSSNALTDQIRQLRSQNIYIPGLEPPDAPRFSGTSTPFVEIVYVLNPAQTMIESIRIVAPKTHGCHWQVEIDGTASRMLPTIGAPERPVRTATGTQVRLRATKTVDKGADL